MKRLGILRHAKSDWDDLSLRDFDRGLNERGRTGAALMGEHIRQHGAHWDALLASPAARVKRTLEAAELGVEPQWDRALYLADSETLVETLRRTDEDIGAMLLAGHNPGLQDLVLALAAPGANEDLEDAVARKYPTAAFAVLELDIEKWADCREGCGRLIHFARPRDLDPELGPQPVG